MSTFNEFHQWEIRHILKKIMEEGKETARPDVIDFCKGIIFPTYLSIEQQSTPDYEFEEYWRNL